MNLASIAVSFLANHAGSAFLSQRLLDTHDFLYPVKGIATFNRPVYALYREGHSQLELIKKLLFLITGITI